MPYSLPDYTILQDFAQNLKIFFEQKCRYNPLPYLQLRQKIATIQSDYIILSGERHVSTTAKMTDLLLPAKRLRQIACIQQLLKDLSPKEEKDVEVNASNNTILLAALMYRCLRLQKEYTPALLPGASFFDRARYYARTAASMVVDRSVESNCTLFIILKKILYYPGHNRLDSLTIKNALEMYYHFINTLPDEKLVHYQDIVEYDHNGKQGYLRNIEHMIDVYRVGAQVLEIELMHIQWMQAIAKILQQWDQMWHTSIEQYKKDPKLHTFDTFLDELRSIISDQIFFCYLEKIVRHRPDIFAKQTQYAELMDTLQVFWDINKQYALLGACFFMCQSIELTEPVWCSDESHQPFLNLFSAIHLGPIDRKEAELSEEYLKDSKYAYQALELFFSVPHIETVFSEDALSYWGNVTLLQKKIMSYQAFQDAEELGFLVIAKTA